MWSFTLFGKNRVAIAKYRTLVVREPIEVATDDGVEPAAMQPSRSARASRIGRAIAAVTADFRSASLRDSLCRHQVAKEYATPFDDMQVGMLRAGEAAGELEKIMAPLAELAERDLDLREKVLGAGDLSDRGGRAGG